MENYPSSIFPSSSSTSNNNNFSSNTIMNSSLFQDVNGNNNPTWFSGMKTDIGSSSQSSGSFGDGTEEKSGGKKKREKKVKKQRYAFQTRSHVDILDDGYRWRKYGQKTVKNNVHPRSYYRCTYQDCNVKKQVQRLCKDEEVVVTTYEGVHAHAIEKSTDNFEHILSHMKIYNGNNFS
ncbi:hypothetical protein GIB67_038788 [Kingdonia uniflora]|uniref:WRKY domain-containing protein n=1 Tax=Kingdonia uniflora TaxID=39325 RepID=A0A7J7M0N3_9MAGN|nr:hypothetical protein GIB67_038788 [Kingdonia uniflora]